MVKIDAKGTIVNNDDKWIYERMITSAEEREEIINF